MKSTLYSRLSAKVIESAILLNSAASMESCDAGLYLGRLQAYSEILENEIGVDLIVTYTKSGLIESIFVNGKKVM